MWLMVAVTGVRGVWAALAPEHFTLFSANTIQLIMFAVLYYLMLTNGFGLLLLVKQSADRELRDSEARFRSYFELPLIGIAITSPDKGWLDANAKRRDMLGYTKAELMTSRISHELRTPLTGILISLELLEMCKPEKRETYMQRLKQSADRLHILIEDVLMFSQLNLYSHRSMCCRSI